jgi:hypothetical protein
MLYMPISLSGGVSKVVGSLGILSWNAAYSLVTRTIDQRDSAANAGLTPKARDTKDFVSRFAQQVLLCIVVAVGVQTIVFTLAL